MVTDVEFLKEELKNEVTEKRYFHSLGVMKMCEKLANMYKVDINNAWKDSSRCMQKEIWL